jgi:hypothetical protein
MEVFMKFILTLLLLLPALSFADADDMYFGSSTSEFNQKPRLQDNDQFFAAANPEFSYGSRTPASVEEKKEFVFSDEVFNGTSSK